MPSQPAPAPSGPAFAVRAEVADAAARSLSYFQGTYAGTLFLAVRLAPDAASQLEAGLSSSAAHARSDAALDVIGFETNEVSLSDVRQIAAHMRRERHDAVREAALLRKRVSECPHYAVPL
ncbi:MAG TPA: hypothetical protein VHM19_12090, partial [Polyangiales bacterium]|nr:hypothetical protein [Polyangiales bacterium]